MGAGPGVGVGGSVDVGTRFKWLWFGARLDAKAMYVIQESFFFIPVTLSANVGLAL